MGALKLLTFGLFVLIVQATNITSGSVQANVESAIDNIRSLTDLSAFRNSYLIDYAKLGDGFYKCDPQTCHLIEPAAMPNANDTRGNYIWSQLDSSYYYCNGHPRSIDNTVCARIEEGNLPYENYITQKTGWSKCEYGLIHNYEANPRGSDRVAEFLYCKTMALKDQLRYTTKKFDPKSSAFQYANGTSLYCLPANTSSCRKLKIDEVLVTRENWIPSWVNSVTHMSGYCDEPSTYQFKPGQRCNVWIKMPEAPCPFAACPPLHSSSQIQGQNTSRSNMPSFPFNGTRYLLPGNGTTDKATSTDSSAVSLFPLGSNIHFPPLNFALPVNGTTNPANTPFTLAQFPTAIPHPFPQYFPSNESNTTDTSYINNPANFTSLFNTSNTDNLTNITLSLLVYPTNISLSAYKHYYISTSLNPDRPFNATKSSILLNSLLPATMLNSAITNTPSQTNTSKWLYAHATGVTAGGAPSWTTLTNSEYGRYMARYPW